MKEHKQVEIRHGRRKAQVDKGIADLILAIWSHQIRTDLSCQENAPGVAWISFPSPKDLEKFFTFLLDWKGICRVTQPAWTINKVSEFKRWHTKIDVIRRRDIFPDGEDTVIIGYSVRLPVSDIKLVTKHLRSKLPPEKPKRSTMVERNQPRYAKPRGERNY